MSNSERKPPKTLTRQETRLLAWQPLCKILLPSTRSRLLRLQASPSYFHTGRLGSWERSIAHPLWACFLFSARQWHLRTRQIEDIRTLETMAGGGRVSSRIVHPLLTVRLRGQWRVQGRGPGDSPAPLFLDKTDTRRAEKNFLGDCSPPYLRVWMTPPPAYLKVWIRHWWHYLFLSSLQEEIKNISCFFPSFFVLSSTLGNERLLLLWQITTATLDRFLLAIEDGYKRPQNPYHNELHATDVTHSVHYFLSRVGLKVSNSAMKETGSS